MSLYVFAHTLDIKDLLETFTERLYLLLKLLIDIEACNQIEVLPYVFCGHFYCVTIFLKFLKLVVILDSERDVNSVQILLRCILKELIVGKSLLIQVVLEIFELYMLAIKDLDERLRELNSKYLAHHDSMGNEFAKNCDVPEVVLLFGNLGVEIVSIDGGVS